MPAIKQKTGQTLSERLKAAQQKMTAQSPQQQGFLWQGPHAEGPSGGITFSMLSRFISCPERFRVGYVLGLRPAERFNHRLSYGNMWHVCEEALAGQQVVNGDGTPKLPTHNIWEKELEAYATGLLRRHPLQQAEVSHWHDVCRLQFPLYVDFWARHKDVIERTPLVQEGVFDVPYPLPSGRTVRLRGKWDSVDLIGSGKGAGIFLQENKTKGDIDEQQIKKQLLADLQTMLYLTVLAELQDHLRWMLDKNNEGTIYEGMWAMDQFRDRLLEMRKQQAFTTLAKQPIKGIRYNVVRRPLSGGKGTIVQHQATKGVKCGKCHGAGYIQLAAGDETEAARCTKCGGAKRIGAKPAETRGDFFQRVEQVIKDEPEHFFMRWTALVQPGDIARFRKECLSPLLERLCDWWGWVNSAKGRADPFADGGGKGLHWRHPYGCENQVDVWGWSDVDDFLNTGAATGLKRRDRLFEELTC